MSFFDRLKSNINKYILTIDSDTLIGKVINAIAKELGDDSANSSSTEKSFNYIIDSADIRSAIQGELDDWGYYFGVFRATGENDSNYRQRILDYVTQEKCTVDSIKAILQPYSVQDVVITEYELEDDTFDGQNTTTDLYPYQYKIDIYRILSKHYCFAIAYSDMNVNNLDQCAVACGCLCAEMGGWFINAHSGFVTGLNLQNQIIDTVNRIKVCGTQPIIIYHSV